MSGSPLESRSLAGAVDLPAVLALFHVCEAADRLDELVSMEELTSDFVSTEPGWRRTVNVWERAGQLVAIAGLWAADDRSHDDSIFAWYNLHPGERSSSTQSAIFAWLVERAGQWAGPDTELELTARTEAEWRLAPIRNAGMREVRRFDRMKRDLTLPIPDAPPPPGYLIRTVAGRDDVEAWVSTYNASFIDHFGFVPQTVEGRIAEMEQPGYLPELDFVAVDPRGSFGAFCWCDTRTPDGRPTEHWVHLLGTHRDHRRRGLATALLSHALRTLRIAGAAEARLAVDSASETGANGLYDRSGFQPYASTLVYRAPLVRLVG